MKTVTISKFHRQGKRANHDCRHFVICPKCGGQKINFVAIIERVTKFDGRVKLESKTVTNQNKGLTVCRDCHYAEGET